MMMMTIMPSNISASYRLFHPAVTLVQNHSVRLEFCVIETNDYVAKKDEELAMNEPVCSL